jgi:sulfoxide reductase heme-binding subunit YedZ
MGFLAFMLLVPLALTSTTRAVRELGGKNWQRLHRLIYVSAVAAVIHFWWKVKADLREPAIYAAILGGLLLLRLAITTREKYRKPSRRLKAEPVQHPGAQPAGGPD